MKNEIELVESLPQDDTGADDERYINATIGLNKFGNKQYFLDDVEVCGRCGERYTNKMLGLECDLCQRIPPY